MASFSNGIVRANACRRRLYRLIFTHNHICEPDCGVETRRLLRLAVAADEPDVTPVAPNRTDLVKHPHSKREPFARLEVLRDVNLKSRLRTGRILIDDVTAPDNYIIDQHLLEAVTKVTFRS
jgi:hypothetical protein